MLRLMLFERRRICQSRPGSKMALILLLVLINLTTTAVLASIQSRHPYSGQVLSRFAEKEKESAKPKQSKVKPTDLICGQHGPDSKVDILGAVQFVNHTYYILYSQSIAQHVVYKIDTNYVVAPFNLVLFNYTELHLMKKLFGFDPAIDRKDKLIVQTAFGFNENSIVLMYDHSNTDCDIIRVDTKAHTTSQVDASLVFIMNAHNEGTMFVAGTNMWKIKDVEFRENTLWRMDYTFGMGQTTDGQTLVYYMRDPIPDGVQIVRWKRFCGYRSKENVVTLFHGDNAYIYLDSITPHEFGNGPNMEHRFRWTKLPLSQYFSCDGSIRNNLDQSTSTLDINNSKSRFRVFTIFALFGLHFFLAAVMLIIILLCSHQTTRSKMLRIVHRSRASPGSKSSQIGSGHSSSSYKRVRKSNRSGGIDSSYDTSTNPSSSASSSAPRSTQTADSQMSNNNNFNNNSDSRLVVVETPFEDRTQSRMGQFDYPVQVQLAPPPPPPQQQQQQQLQYPQNPPPTPNPPPPAH